MPIIQEQPPEPAVPSQIVATSLDPPRDLEYPHAPIAAKAGSAAMPLILWSLGLLFGILIFLVRLPLNAPPINQLTTYTCEPLPRLPNLGNRSQSYPLNLRCKAGDQVIYQRTNNIPYSNQAAANTCIKEGRQTQIWRAAPLSSYGSYVFQVTCGDLIITNYKTRAAIYETIQRFVIAVACILTIVSAIGLGRKVLQLFRLRARSSAAQHG